MREAMSRRSIIARNLMTQRSSGAAAEGITAIAARPVIGGARWRAVARSVPWARVGIRSGRSHWRREGVKAIRTLFGVTVAVVAVGVGGCAYVLSRINWSFDRVDKYRPTAAELRASATTVPPSSAQCRALRPLYRATGRVAGATAFSLNGQTTPDRALVELVVLDRALAQATRAARDPVRNRFVRADQRLHDAEAVLGRWRRATLDARSRSQIDKQLATSIDAGYTDLRVAERLLGDACGSRPLVPDGNSLIAGQWYLWLLSVHTTTTTTTALAA